MSTVRGQVGASGNPVLGDGFSSERTGTGTYTVTFDSAFKELPVIVATALATSSGQDRIVTLYSSSREEFSITTRKAKTSDRENTAFNFEASDDYTCPDC